MVRLALATTAAFLLVPAASAAPQGLEACRGIANAAERLACYDRVASSAPASPEPSESGQPAPRSAALPPAPPHQPRSERKPTRHERAESANEGTIAAVTPLRHGYFRLQLENGGAYETTVVGTPPPVGAAVRIRRTFLGTTFFDIKGWSPIAVRLSPEQ